MAVSIYTLMERSITNMGAVHPKVKDLALELIRLAYHEGLYVQITSGYRSNAEQLKLYNQGRTTPGAKVTNAGPGQSVHNYGYAIDYVLVSEDGARAIWVVNADWRRVAAIGKRLGFQWGGDWSKFPDPPHLDVGGLSWQQLKAGRRPTVPNVPERNYLGIGDSGPKVKALQDCLNRVGIKIAVDSDYGPATEAAVKRFQEKRGLAADGFYGPGGAAEMNKALKEGKEPVPTVKPAGGPKKEEDEQVELTAAQRKELAAIFKEAREKDIFSSDEHEKSIVDGTMSVSRLMYLQTIIAGAALNGGKRIQ
jgi:peptidoglycan L-alanyl-D-glutamate endopeptidase CwlK